MAKRTLEGTLVAAGHWTEHEHGILTRLVPDVELVPSDADDPDSPKRPMMVEREVHSIGVVAERQVFHFAVDVAGERHEFVDVDRDLMPGLEPLVGDPVVVTVDGQAVVGVKGA